MPGAIEFDIKINQSSFNRFKTATIKSVRTRVLNNPKILLNLDKIKEKVLDRGESYIDSHRKRPSNDQGKHKLIDVIREGSYIEKTANGWRLGIGKIKDLNSKVPYWRLVNYGGIIKAKGFLGIFGDGKPEEGRKGSPFYHGGTNSEGKMFFMQPKNPIAPMRYLNYMAKIFKLELSKFGKSKGK